MAPRKLYTPEQMQKTVEAVKKGEKVAIAATKFGVPRITLHNKITGKSPLTCSMGPTTYLSKQDEDVLENWIIDMNNKHIPITKDQLLDSVQRIITDKKQETPFNDNRPGKKWYNLFMKRHPNISERTAQNLTMARDNVSEKDIERWFKEVGDYLQENDLVSVLKEPERVFNTDESAFFLSPKPGRVLDQKGEKHIYSSSGDEKDNLTVLVTGNAAGQLAPPMVVFSYESIPSAIAANFPHDWAIGKSQTGWMCGSTFYEYIANIFYPWLIQQNIKTPVLFFLDGHKSHLTLHLSNFCVEHGIEVIILNPNSTHIMQPMDLAVFRPLKASWKRAVNNWKMCNLGQNLKKEHFAPVLKTALETLTEGTIKNGFRSGGLCPFGPSYVDYTKIKSHRSRQDTINPGSSEKTCLQHLEKEITDVFRHEKLDLFKELFYKSRDELDDRLPAEDTSLYVIWARLKQSVVKWNASMVAPEHQETTRAFLPDIEEITIGENEIPIVTLSENNLQENTSVYSITIETDTKLLESSIEEVCSSRQLAVTPDINIIPEEKITREVQAKPKPFNLEATKDNSTAILKKKENIIIPSPFKRNLFWPEEEDIQKGKKRRLKEKIPSVVTSHAWIKYHENKQSAKKLKLEEKEKRAKEREDKKLLKEALKKQKKEKSKPRQPDITSSDETDTELQYAESDDSYLGETYLAKFRKTQPDNYSSSESEDLPLSKLSEKGKNLSKGTYVIVAYEGEYFPGVIENVDQESFEISTMTFSTGNTFRWPTKPDKIWYAKKDVVESINNPLLSNKRGFYVVKEMNKYLPFVV